MALQGRAVRFASFVFALFAFLAASQAFAALTYSWTGAASNKWSNPGNWNPAGVPTDGDTLAFPSGAANTTNVNDLPAGTSFVTVGVLGFGYNLSGNGIVVTSSVSSVYNGTVFALPIDFQANNATLSTNSSRFTGPISGSGTLTLSQSVQLEGAGTFSGTLTATN